MPDSKISALPSATVPLAGTEVLPVVQGGTTDKVTAADLLRQNGQTVTTSNPVLSLAQTWNAGAVTFTGMLFNATNTASAAASLLLDLQVGGTSQFKVDRTGVGTFVGNLNIPSLLSSGTVFTTRMNITTLGGQIDIYGDTILARDAANTLALRNSTNAQTFRVYNTYTDASNYERLAVEWTGNTAYIRTQNTGTGASRSIILSASTAFYFGGGASYQWLVSSSGHLLANSDNIYDIGASGATRPRNIFVANSVTAGVGYITANNAYYAWTGRSVMRSGADGHIVLTNAAETDFTRLQFGGTTSSFPALKRSSAELQARLADDSAYADVRAQGVYAQYSVYCAPALAIPAGGTAGRGVLVSSATNFGVFFGSGAPTLSAAKGSLYLRSDGSGTGDRMYVNTDGSTTWTAVTTAA